MIRPEKMKPSCKDGKSRATISRRQFIRDLSTGAAGVALASSFSGLALSEAKKAQDLSKVVIARHPNSVIGSLPSVTFDQSVVGELVNLAIADLTGQEAPGLAWAQVFPGLTASNVIGIKVNCINSSCSSHPEVAHAIVEGLASMQVGSGNFPRNNIIVWDRLNAELSNAGYNHYTGSDPDAVRCFGTDESGYGYDSGSSIIVTGHTCNPSSILAQHSDYLINLAVLKNWQGAAGVTLSLKNHLGSIHNPSAMHGMDPDIAELSAEIRDSLDNKHRLAIIDALVGVRLGGPGSSPQFIYGGIIIGTDLVAVDYNGRQVLADNGCATTGAATYIETADDTYELGTANPAEMDVVEHNPIAPATREHVDKMIRFHKEGLATPLQVQWAINRYARGM
ncbi:MAG: hypothetical protein AMJ92_04390 [candidate division Zixibacteria bacterium SM23_81]|nr:MAG: hypothetical protein AMJ92_04390 [candidate division Zixibacteria bacterium SM23_81]